MPSTVLGKRTRSGKDSTLNAHSTRAKRQARPDRVTPSPSKTETKPVAKENVQPIRTPQTPRHRDALSKTTPVTPRHRVQVPGIPFAFTPPSSRTPSAPRENTKTVYSSARLLFTRSSDSGLLVGRDTERAELTSFLETRISNPSGGCTYVSGPPGTGKSAMVNEITSTFEESPTLKKCYINCMSIKNTKDMFSTLVSSLCSDIDESEESNLTQTLQSMFIPRKKSEKVYLVVLDEIDHILTLDLEILYKLFEWSLSKTSRLVLIGIANALDLTDRFLPRLKSRSLKPSLLPFLPYTAPQIKSILTERLKSLNSADAQPGWTPFLHPAAIELCARKVASQTGDLRKAFDICRRCIDLIESETKAKHASAFNTPPEPPGTPSKGAPLSENPNLSSPAKPVMSRTVTESLAALTPTTAPRASISHMNKVTSSLFSALGTSKRLNALNLQQKAALCALVALEKHNRAQRSSLFSTPSKSTNNLVSPTVKKLYDTYAMLCKRDSLLQPLSSVEFRDVVGSLETLSLVCAVDGKTGSFSGAIGSGVGVPGTPSKRGRKPGWGSGVGVGDERRVGSCVGEKEVEAAVDGIGGGILRGILVGEGLE